MVPLRPKVTHVNEESMATFEVAVALAVSDARSDGMLTETPTDWQSYGSPCQRTAFASCSKRKGELTASPKATPVASSSAEQVETMHCETPWMKVSEEHRHWLSDEAHEVIAAVCPMQLMTLYQHPQRRQLFAGEREGGMALGTHQVGGAL